MSCADDGDDCGDEFVGYNEWATQQLGVTLFTDFVYDYDDGERGVFVAEDIAPQTRVVSVPFASLLTLEWLREQAQRGHAVYSRVAIFRALSETPRDELEVEGEDDLLAVALLYERFVERGRSFWHPHLELLPKSYDNLLYFTDGELQHLRGSNAFFLAKQMQQKVAEDYARLEASVIPELVDAVLGSRDDLDGDALREGFAIDQYQWALSTIWSRFVSLRMHEDRDGAFPVLKAMAPVFDMLNHDPMAEVSHGYNAATHALEVVTHQHVAAGTQLCIHYGAMSNHKLLTLYGFVVHGNPFDSIDLWMPMDKETVSMYEAKAGTLKNLGIDHETTAYELTADAGDLDLTLLLAARVMELECRDQAELESCVERLRLGQVISYDNEEHAFGLLIHTIESMITQYGERDPEPAPESDPVHVRHVEMAKMVCESDYQILVHTRDVLKGMLWQVLQAKRDERLQTML